MRLSTFLLLLASSLAPLCSARIFSGSAMEGLEEAANFQAGQLERMRSFLGPSQAPDASQLEKREPIISFKNPRANEFHVDGTKIPDGE